MSQRDDRVMKTRNVRAGMLSPRLSKLNLLQSTAYFSAIVACAVVASILLVSLAPGRVMEIYAAGLLGVIVGATAWALSRSMPRIKLALLLTTMLLTIGMIVGGYLTFLRHFHKEFPPVAEYLDIDTARPGEAGTSQTPRDALLALVQETHGFRLRLFESLNGPVRDEEVLSKADAFVKSSYEFFNYAPAQLPPSLAWDEDPYNNRSWNWALHNMDYVVTLTRAFEATNESKYLQRAEDIILNWIDVNTRYLLKPPSVFSWGDHTTALRLQNWLYFFDVWKTSELVSPEHAEIIFRSMLGHAQMLSDSSFYTDKHNHGIDQDRALLAFSLTFPQTAKSADWKELALSRLSTQVQFAISPNGIHMEHSPGYQLYGMLQLNKTLSFLNQWEVRHGVVDMMAERLVSMSDYVPNIVKPDGYLVKVGDTSNSHITGWGDPLLLLETVSPVLRELAETGATNKLADMSSAFPTEGYAVIRDFERGQRDFQNSFYLFFASAAHQGYAHRHADDLSFVLSHGGREIFIDPGIHSYNRRDPARAYVVSAAAHNSVVIDGTTYKGWDTSFDGHLTNDRFTLIRGSHRNYPGFEHIRWLLYLRPTMLFVIDRVRPINSSKADGDHQFEQLFHLSSTLDVTLDEDKGSATVFSSKPDQRPVLLLTQLGNQARSMRVASGEKSPMQGWDSTAYAKLTPAPTLISLQRGMQTEFVTAIQLPAIGQTLGKLQEIRRSLQSAMDAQTLKLNWTEGGTQHKLELDLNTNGVSIN